MDSASSPATVASLVNVFATFRFRRFRFLRPTAASVFITTGALDNASATTFVLPGRYSTVKSYSCRMRAHRCSFPVKFELVISHFSAA
eukprot:jgi/Phyca11/133094/e_gw1.320.5.1